MTAAASASARALEASDRTDPAWEHWLGGRFTKSVRVAKSHADFALAIASCAYAVEEQGVRAAAFAPLTYAEMPRWMSRARVEGLHCADDLPEHPGSSEWSVGVIGNMSAGKMAAQVAHALCAIVLEVGNLPTFDVYRAPASASGQIEIVDAGLTEFDGVPTRTVVASPR
ncbi:hypothetical protein [Tsukamurella tyrosinosolvens]|uniref:hypothetical protein n=1 Tax=Tsukamurella tyrosinosolvens TaxID=57704 RepID=UPI001114F859|nr:hypothetical protein [Tsukamurella tyrosinosolvens]